MSDLYWLADEQMARLQPSFPKSHGRARVDDRRVLSGIIFVNLNGLRWRDAPREYGLAKMLYNRWRRWSDKGIFIRMMEGLAASQALERKTIKIDATYLKAHCTASSLRVKKGARQSFWINYWQARMQLLRCRRKTPVPTAILARPEPDRTSLCQAQAAPTQSRRAHH